MKKNETSLYFIGCLSPAEKVKAVKIGYARDIATRLSELQVGNHMPLRLIAWFPAPNRYKAKQWEEQLHWRFRQQHIRGEWFAGGKCVSRYTGFMFDQYGVMPGRMDPV